MWLNPSLRSSFFHLTNQAIEDPNTDVVLWESGAIITYLIEQYDGEHVLSYDTLKEKHECNQWCKIDTDMFSNAPHFFSVFDHYNKRYRN